MQVSVEIAVVEVEVEDFVDFAMDSGMSHG